MQDRQLLRHQLGIEKIDTRQVTSRAGEARDKTEPDRVFRNDKDDRDRRGCRLCSQYDSSTSTRVNGGDLPTNQLRRQFLHSLEFIFSPAVEDRYVVAFHIAGFSEALTKSAQTVRHRVR